MKGHSDFKIKTCFFFSETVSSFGTKVHKKAFFGENGNEGMNTSTNELDCMTKMAAMSVYGKNL